MRRVTLSGPCNDLCVNWLAKGFGKSYESLFRSCMINVTNGKCMSVIGGTSWVNMQNLVAIVDAVESMVASGIHLRNILIVLWYAEDVRVLKRMFKVAKIPGVNVRDVTDAVVTLDSIQGTENLSPSCPQARTESKLWASLTRCKD